MPVPSEIIDSLESITEIFLSGIKHRERAAFILCDNLIEMACKTKAKQRDRNFNLSCGFHTAWNAQGVNFPPMGIGGRVQSRRDTRNLMQHANASITVDRQSCADAIVDAVEVINRLWRNTSERSFPFWIKAALRTVKLYSSVGPADIRQKFEDEMRKAAWRSVTEERRPKVNEIIIEPGLNPYWFIIIKKNPELVDSILNSLENTPEMVE